MFTELERGRKPLGESETESKDKANVSKGKQTKPFSLLPRFLVLPEFNLESTTMEESVCSRRKHDPKYCCEIRKVRSCQKTEKR